MRLERILQKHGFGTRKGCRDLILQDRVCIEGRIIDNPDAEIPTDGLFFTVDGVQWPFCEFARLVLHKPAGYECSQKPSYYPSVLTLLPLPLRLRGVQCVGRLDQDTTGLLIVTDDGQLNHALTSARRKLPKVYHVMTKHPVDLTQCTQLCSGVLLHDDPEPVRAVSAEIVSEYCLKLTIAEGKYHQVKRMVAAAGNRVESLSRISIGAFCLPDHLAPGEWAWLSDHDMSQLLRSPELSEDKP